MFLENAKYAFDMNIVDKIRYDANLRAYEQ